MSFETAQTHCDANCVNNDAIPTPREPLLSKNCPADECEFTVYDNTVMTFNQAGGVEVKISSPSPFGIKRTILSGVPGSGMANTMQLRNEPRPRTLPA